MPYTIDILGLSVPEPVFLAVWLVCALAIPLLYAPEITSLIQRSMDRLPGTLSGRMTGKTLYRAMMFVLVCAAAAVWLNHAGSTGTDRPQGTAGNDRLQGQAGDDILSGRKGADILIGGRGADRLKGGRGDDTLRGGPGNDNLRGGRGDDILDGGKGDDTLRGGPGRDRFVFRRPLFGQDSVEDFTHGQDVLRFSGQKLQRSDMRVEQIGGNAVITVKADPTASVTLIGVDAGLLSDADFIFD